MKKRLVPILAIYLLASAAFAAGLSVEKSYSFHQKYHSSKDEACISAFTNTVAPQFQGLTGLQLAAPTIVDTSLGALTAYPDVVFLSSYGDTQGVIICVFSKAGEPPTDVSVSFSGSGLGGFEKIGRIATSNDPADWKAKSFSSQVNLEHSILPKND